MKSEDKIFETKVLEKVNFIKANSIASKINEKLKVNSTSDNNVFIPKERENLGFNKTYTTPSQINENMSNKSLRITLDKFLLIMNFITLSKILHFYQS